MFSRNEGFEVIDETHEYVVVEDVKAQRKKSILKYLIVVVMAVLGYFALTTDSIQESNEEMITQAINGADVFDDISECWNTVYIFQFIHYFCFCFLIFRCNVFVSVATTRRLGV